ncbi:DoxX family protein [bacterium]|nr:DoxX family protein [bacterium]
MRRANPARGPLALDLGLLLLRVAGGASMLVFHGWGKLTGGPDTWRRVGEAMGNLGLHAWPVVWGAAAAFAESLGALLVLVGLFTRPAAGLLAITMLVAALYHLNLPPASAGAGWQGASHALELLGVFLALALAGPGRFAIRR